MCIYLQCRLHWHKQGNYLCVRVDHYITKKVKDHQTYILVYAASLSCVFFSHCSKRDAVLRSFTCERQTFPSTP